MNVRKYVGTGIDDVLRKVKSDLGKDPVILNVRVVKRRGLLRLFLKDRCEVIAGKGFKTALEAKAAAGDAPVRKPAVVEKAAKAYGGQAPPRPLSSAPPQPLSSAPSLGTLKKDVEELKILLKDIGNRISRPEAAACPEELREHYLLLLSNAVSERLAAKLVGELRQNVAPEELRDPKAIHRKILHAVGGMIETSDGIAFVPGRCVKAAFIGPTGVGKTTTIAKLMAVYANRGKEVGVITCDTQRIAAADQLRRVAELVGVPIKVAATPADIRMALEGFRAMDLVLIDTAGRGQRNEKMMTELNAIIGAAEPDEVHLVLDSGKQPDAILDVVERFSKVRVTNLVLTKVDEAVKLGVVLDVLAKADKKLSFVTTGQEIPRDIEIADAGRLSRMILREDALVAVQ